MKIDWDFDLERLGDYLRSPLYQMVLLCKQEDRQLKEGLGLDLIAYANNESDLKPPAPVSEARRTGIRAMAKCHDPNDHIGAFFREVAYGTVEIKEANAYLTRRGVNEILEAITAVRRLFP